MVRKEFLKLHIVHICLYIHTCNNKGKRDHDFDSRKEFIKVLDSRKHKEK